MCHTAGLGLGFMSGFGVFWINCSEEQTKLVSKQSFRQSERLNTILVSESFDPEINSG